MPGVGCRHCPPGEGGHETEGRPPAFASPVLDLITILPPLLDLTPSERTGPDETQHRPHPHHPCRQPDPSAASCWCSCAAQQSGKSYDKAAYAQCLKDSVADVVAQAGRGRHRRRQRRRVRQIDQLVAICAGAPQRLRAPAVPRRKSVRTWLDRSRFPEFYAEPGFAQGRSRPRWTSVAVAPIKYTGQALLQVDIDNFKAALKRRQGRGGVPAGRGAGERDSRSQERILQER